MSYEDNPSYVDIDNVTAKAETSKALLVIIDDEEHWIPKSQISDLSEVYATGHEGTLTVKLWLAEQEGLV